MKSRRPASSMPYSSRSKSGNTMANSTIACALVFLGVDLYNFIAKILIFLILSLISLQLCPMRHSYYKATHKSVNYKADYSLDFQLRILAISDTSGKN